MYFADDVSSVVHAPIALDPLFPITVGPAETQYDQPIRQLHWHDSIEIGLCIEGAGVFVVGEKVLPFAEGDVTLIGPTEVHLARSAPGTVSRWHWIYLDPIRFLRSMNDDAPVSDLFELAGAGFDNVLRHSEDPEIASIVWRLVDELRSHRLGYRSLSEALAVQLFVHARRIRPTDSPDRFTSRQPGLARVAPAIALIVSTLGEPLTIADLSRACGVSEATLRRLFVDATGRSPQQYWLDLRLHMASSMLRSTTLSVLEVSTQVGFRTLSTFNVQFLRRYGVTPRDWRRGAT